MVVPPCFELRFAATYIMTFFFISFHGSFVYDRFPSAFTVDRAGSATVAWFGRIGASVQDFLVVARYNSLHIRHAAVTQLDCISVENFTIFAVRRKMLID